jgi:hypothetical protein
VPARKKTLADLARDRTFLARRHRHLLLEGPLLADPALRVLQERYRAEGSDLEQLRIARELERLLRAQPKAGTAELDRVLAELGRAGSAEQVLGFLTRFLSHRAGPLAGKPFRLERTQQGQNSGSWVCKVSEA